VSGIEKLLKALVDSQVNFIVVGAYAAIMQGSTLRTDDLDICYERTPENYRKIIKAVRGFHPRLRDIPDDVEAPFDEHSLAQGTNFTLMTDQGPLDLLGEMAGVGGYRQILPEAKTFNLGTITCRVASLATLIRSKEAANRPKDRLVLPELRALKMIQDKEREGRDR
jgi:hypothetical protein